MTAQQEELLGRLRAEIPRDGDPRRAAWDAARKTRAVFGDINDAREVIEQFAGERSMGMAFVENVCAAFPKVGIPDTGGGGLRAMVERARTVNPTIDGDGWPTETFKADCAVILDVARSLSDGGKRTFTLTTRSLASAMGFDAVYGGEAPYRANNAIRELIARGYLTEVGDRGPRKPRVLRLADSHAQGEPARPIESTPELGASERGILDQWNATAARSGFRITRRVTPSLAAALTARCADPAWVADVPEALEQAGRSDFLRGMTKRTVNFANWKPDLAWFCKPDTVSTILNGTYDPVRTSAEYIPDPSNPYF